MGNLIYVLIIIVYIIFQVQQAKKRKQKQEEAQQKSATAAELSQKKESPVLPQTPEERMKEIFRQIEMKTNPYARPDKPSTVPKSVASRNQPSSKPINKAQQKKPPVPFLNVDMTEEELSPEGAPSKLSEDAFAKHQVSNFDYNAVEKAAVPKFNLRNAMIGKIIFDRPEW